MELNLFENLCILEGFCIFVVDMGIIVVGLVNVWFLVQGLYVILILGMWLVEYFCECVFGLVVSFIVIDLDCIEVVLFVGWVYGDRYLVD